MSIECGECERDSRGGHAEDCPRRPRCKSGPDDVYTHRWKIGASDWDDLPEEVTGCATCQDCGRQEFVYKCAEQRSVNCSGRAVNRDACEACYYEEY